MKTPTSASNEIATINEINFGQLYIRHLAKTHYHPKPASEWDNKARSFKNASGSLHSTYQQDFVSRLNISNCKTVLDVGCGAGTIGLSMADSVEHVYGLDYSKSMLEAFHANAINNDIRNVSTFHLSWENSWEEVPLCDIVIASRAMLVGDLKQALIKLNHHAKKRVYLTQSANPHFISPEILTAIGRDCIGMPDYIYTLNILYQLGIYPTLSYIESEHYSPPSISFDELISNIEWSIGTLNDDEKTRLHTYYQQHIEGSDLPQKTTRKWAFISWKKE